jgi:hypothetical protein
VTPKPSILTRILTALGISRSRTVLPTWMGTAEIRKLGGLIFRNAFFSARTTHARYLTVAKEMVDGLLEGEMDLPLARLTLKRMMQAIGYTPEGGFPDDPDGAKIPPAIAGQIEDLSSNRRIEFMLRTQEQLMQGAAQKAKGHEVTALRVFPGWELVRVGERAEPRDWPARWLLALENLDRPAVLPRDAQGNVRLVAMKGDPIWAALGSSELFKDALDVDHPPFAFGSGMGWAGVDRQELRELGITGPEGETVDDVLRVLPRPSASALGIDPEILKKLVADLKAKDAAEGRLEGGDA